MCVCVLRVCVCACVRGCVRVCVRATLAGVYVCYLRSAVAKMGIRNNLHVFCESGIFTKIRETRL